MKLKKRLCGPIDHFLLLFDVPRSRENEMAEEEEEKVLRKADQCQLNV